MTPAERQQFNALIARVAALEQRQIAGRGISTLYGGAITQRTTQIGFPAELTSTWNSDVGYDWKRLDLDTSTADISDPSVQPTGNQAFALDGNEMLAVGTGPVWMEPNPVGPGYLFTSPGISPCGEGGSGSGGDCFTTRAFVTNACDTPVPGSGGGTNRTIEYQFLKLPASAFVGSPFCVVNPTNCCLSPPPPPPLTDCCDNPVSATLCVTISGYCGCLNGTYTVEYDSTITAFPTWIGYATLCDSILPYQLTVQCTDGVWEFFLRRSDCSAAITFVSAVCDPFLLTFSGEIDSSCRPADCLDPGTITVVVSDPPCDGSSDAYYCILAAGDNCAAPMAPPVCTPAGSVPSDAVVCSGPYSSSAACDAACVSPPTDPCCGYGILDPDHPDMLVTLTGTIAPGSHTLTWNGSTSWTWTDGSNTLVLTCDGTRWILSGGGPPSFTVYSVSIVCSPFMVDFGSFVVAGNTETAVATLA